MILSKNDSNKKHTPKLVFFYEKSWERFGWFLTQKIDFESQILALFDTAPSTQFSKFNHFLWADWFLGKNILVFHPLLENSITRIPILNISVKVLAPQLSEYRAAWGSGNEKETRRKRNSKPSNHYFCTKEELRRKLLSFYHNDHKKRMSREFYWTKARKKVFANQRLSNSG